MTKEQKESAPVVDLEKKEKTISALKGAEEKLAKLRADIENDDNPDVTLFIASCNKKTGAVSSTIFGSDRGLMTTIASAIRDDKSLRTIVTRALVLSI